jgi:hypothetical protein
MDQAKFWVEIIAALTVPICFVAVIVHRVKQELGMGYRAIQFLALGAALPIVLILGLEKIIEAGTIGTLLGAVLGYVFSTSAGTNKNA